MADRGVRLRRVDDWHGDRVFEVVLADGAVVGELQRRVRPLTTLRPDKNSLYGNSFRGSETSWLVRLPDEEWLQVRVTRGEEATRRDAVDSLLRASAHARTADA